MGAAGGGVGKDAVDADGDEHESDGAEDGQQQEAEARSSVREGGDKAFECTSEREGDVAVGGPDFVADGVHHGHGLGTGAHQNAARAGTGHRIGNPEFRIRRILQAMVLRVGDDTDDLEPGIGELVWKLLELRDVHALTDGIFVAEIFVGEGLVNDGELALPFHLGFSERASVDELDFQDREIAFTAKLEERGPFFGVSLAGNLDVGVDAAVGRKCTGSGRKKPAS